MSVLFYSAEIDYINIVEFINGVGMRHNWKEKGEAYDGRIYYQ